MSRSWCQKDTGTGSWQTHEHPVRNSHVNYVLEAQVVQCVDIDTVAGSDGNAVWPGPYGLNRERKREFRHDDSGEIVINNLL